MSRKSVLIIVFTVIAVVVALSVLFVPSLLSRDEDAKYKYIPNVSNVSFSSWQEENLAYVRMAIELPNPGFNITWGTPKFDGNTISVNSEIRRLSGVFPAMIIRVANTCSLGDLSTGQYYFVFKAWDSIVRIDGFHVS